MLTPSRDAARAVLDDRVELDGDVTLFPRDIELHFADAYDKLLRATDGLDLARDLLAGVRDFHQAQVANDQNEVMKRLTVVASVLLLPTFIVGLYGQNLQGCAGAPLGARLRLLVGASSSSRRSPSSCTSGASSGSDQAERESAAQPALRATPPRRNPYSVPDEVRDQMLTHCEEKVSEVGYRNSEILQRREGLRLHLARRSEGRLRPLLQHSR